MSQRLPDHLMSRLSELIAKRTALQYSPERWNDLDRRVGYAAGDFGFDDKESFVLWLLSTTLNQDHLKLLARHLTISETYFWREPRIFEALQEQILPELIRSRQNGGRLLRIWSAGCATGEEPYSIAVALKRTVPGLRDWRVNILATDINPWILRKARAGVYFKWSFRDSPEWLKKEYFFCRDSGKSYEIIPELRDMVSFEYLNMAEDAYPSPLNNTSAMDIIFCRNMLMYFSPEQSRRIIKKLSGCMSGGGWLIVGASELSYHSFPQFTPVHFHGAIVYRKLEAKKKLPVFLFEALEPLQKETPALEHPAGIKAFNEPSQFRADNKTPLAPDNSEDVKIISKECVECDENKTVQTNHTGLVAHCARNLADRGKLTEALALCEKAIAEAKLDPAIHYLHGIMLQENNCLEDAIASLKRAVYLDPDFVPANFMLGNLLLRKGNAKDGKKYFKYTLRLLGNRPDNDILPEADGVTSGRLKQIIHAAMGE
jgi:chemotaxis protein methyltransferase CheR